jgi:hypothetical protein
MKTMQVLCTSRKQDQKVFFVSVGNGRAFQDERRVGFTPARLGGQNMAFFEHQSSVRHGKHAA